jgi:hypothetical protein
MIWPEVMLAPMSENIIGVSTAPLCVADLPMTPWMKSGMNRIVPNMPIAISASARTAAETTLLWNKLSGMIGSIARDSTRPKMTSMIRATANRPMMTGEVQG